jgi:uncharacterized protein (TIGR00290 family)
MCWSGGKDSALALYELQQSAEYEAVSLLTTVTSGYDRISMHGVRRALLAEQAEALGLPLVEVEIRPKASNEIYEAQMGEAFAGFRRQGIGHVAFGDIFLADLREYRERLLARHDLDAVFPIWHRDTRELARTFVRLGFRALACCVDPQRLDECFAGRELDHSFFDELPETVDHCGENGEYHSFVFDGPNFRRPISIAAGEKLRRDSFLFCDLVSEAAPMVTRRVSEAPNAMLPR